MAMTIVEAARGVTGGVDTHLDVHVAAALDPVRAENFIRRPHAASSYSWMSPPRRSDLRSFVDIGRRGRHQRRGPRER